MRITVLMENTGPEGLVHEHGLSFYLEYRGGRYLLDAGHSGRFVQNAAALGADLAAVDAAALSHGHYDHSDGLGAFFAANATAKVFARPAVTLPCYDETEIPPRFIGVDPQLFAQYPDRFDLADGPRLLAPGLHLIPDQVPHEQSLVAETEGGLVILNSCCHAGAGFLVRDIAGRFPGRPVRALVGGLHLMGQAGTGSLGVSPGIVKNLARWLTEELGAQEVYTGHCTGAPAMALLREEAGDRIRPLTTGAVYSF